MSLPPASAADLEQSLEANRAARWNLKLDLITSYAWSGTRVLSNVIVLAVLYRYTDTRFVSAYLVIRSMLWLLTYVFGAFNPAVQKILADRETLPEATVAPEPDDPPDKTVPYASGRYTTPQNEIGTIYTTSSFIVGVLLFPAIFVVSVYAGLINEIHDLATHRAHGFAFAFGAALLTRLISEPASAMLQSRNRLWVDNVAQIGCELVWVLTLPLCIRFLYRDTLYNIGVSYWAVSALLTIVRLLAVRDLFATELTGVWKINRAWISPLLYSGAILCVGQFADFLYAPANILLIDRLVDPLAVARYAPALQIDAGLLLLVSAVSTVMLPRAMSAWARGERALLRRAYIHSTLACLLVLATAAFVVGMLIEPILKLWLGTVPEQTPTITRLVLIHTVIGGTAGIGRSVLLGMGRFKAYTLSALLGGVANVGLALLFVLVLGWGLKGIVLATVIAVTARCAVWMPWYILRSLRDESTQTPSITPVEAVS